MSIEDALKFLKQVLVTKPGLTLGQCAAVVVAWNVLAQAGQVKEDAKEE